MSVKLLTVVAGVVLSLILISSETFGQDLKRFEEFIDSSVSPCEDFYEYACGKWTPLNAEASDVINDQRQENRNLLRDLYSSMQREQKEENHPPSKFYFLCLNSKFQKDNEVLANYMSTLVNYSDWPYLNETFDGSTYDWLQVAAKLRTHRVDTFFKLSVNRNWKKSQQHHVLYITPLKKPFEGSPEGDDAFMYQTYVKYILLAFGVRVRKAKEYAQEVVEFEHELDKIGQSIEDRLIDPILIDKLYDELPQLNFEQYFKTLLDGDVRGAAKRTPQIVVQIEYLKKLELLVRKTKTETVALYQLAKFLHHYELKLDPPNWKDCIDEVSDKLPMHVANDFESSTNDDLRAREVFDKLQKEFIMQIKNSSWYSEQTRTEIIAKLESVQLDIGISDPGIQLEPEAEIHQPNYQQARMAFDKLAASNEFYQLQSYNKLASDNLKPLRVNAYYKLNTNVLEIPIGLLRSPLYRKDSNEAQLMGSLGSIFGHELVHGLDYDGQNYDEDGNVIMEPNPKDIIQFGKRANCFIDQYESEGQIGALNEDVADSEGLRLAYRAYMQQPTVSTKSTFSDKQLFFLSYAQIWCRAKGSSSLARSTHSAHRYRVNNVVANAENFAEAFTCSKSSKLNPDKKCKIW